MFFSANVILKLVEFNISVKIDWLTDLDTLGSLGCKHSISSLTGTPSTGERLTYDISRILYRPLNSLVITIYAYPDQPPTSCKAPRTLRYKVNALEGEQFFL